MNDDRDQATRETTPSTDIVRQAYRKPTVESLDVAATAGKAFSNPTEASPMTGS